MSSLKLRYLFKDPHSLKKGILPDYTSLDFVSNGSHIYGEILRILKSERDKEAVRRHETLTASFWENLKTKRSYEK